MPLSLSRPLWLLLVLLLLPLFAAPGEDFPMESLAAAGDQPVKLEADQLNYDEQLGLYRASGNVLLQIDRLRLSCDAVEYSLATGDALARGHVVFQTPDGTMRGDELKVNLQTGFGSLREGELLITQNNFHIAGQEIARIGEQTFRVERGSFTTCEGSRPDWKFSAREMEVTVGGYAKGRHAVFHVADLPVLYTPYLVFPAKRERESGMLVPDFGYSEKRGVELNLAWYWVIARNQDATFYLDYLSRLGIGKGVEYRYVFARDNAGEALFYHINGISGERSRYAFEWAHLGDLPNDVRVAADVEYVSSRDYFEDFGRIAEEYNKDKAQSTLSAARHFADSYTLIGQLKYTKDLDQPSDSTLQRLPEVRFAALRQPIGRSSNFWGVDSSATYFWRREGLRGKRLLLRPFLATVWQPGRLLEIEPEIGYTRRAYWTTNDVDKGSDGDGIFDFSTRVSSRFVRVYDVDGEQVRKLRHSVEPDVVYTFIPDDDQEDIPSFDTSDRIEASNLVSYGVTNRFTARIEEDGRVPRYHEYAYLRLSQEYDIKESRRDLLDPAESRQPFSSLRVELIARPTRNSLLDIDARYDPNSAIQDFTTFNAGGAVHDDRGNRIDLNYRFRRDSQKYFSGNLDLAWFKPVYLKYQHRYDYRDNITLEQVVGLEYRAQCWSLYLTYRDRLEDREYLVTFSLSGLGRIARFSGTLGETQTAAP